MSASSRCQAGRYPLPATIPLGIVTFLLLALSCFPSPSPLFGQSQAAGQAPTSQAATPAEAQSNPASQQPGTTTSKPQGSDEKDLAELTTHQESNTTFKVNVNLVVVRVVVRDGQGHAVGNLQKEDFELFDNGKPQLISKFAVEQAASKAPPPGGTAADKAQAPATPDRFVAYLFDDIYLNSADIIQTRNAALQHLNTLLPTDRAAVYTTSGTDMQDFTDDRAKLRDALMRIRPSPVSKHQPAGDCPDISYYLADKIINQHDSQALRVSVQDTVICLQLPTATPAEAEAAEKTAQQVVVSASQQILTNASEQSRLALGTLRDVVRRTALMPGQRTVILVSPGFLLIDTLQMQVDIIERALRSNVIISTLDGRGLSAAGAGGLPDISKSRMPSASLLPYFHQYDSESALLQSNILSELAYGTGGTYFHNNNDLQDGFRRTAAAPEYYYVLAFAPQNLKNDGKYHSLKVTLKEKQPYSLQARKGYYAPKAAASGAEQAKSDIQDAVFSQEERNDLPMELNTKFFKTGGDAAKLAVLVRVDVRHIRYQKVDGRNRNDLMVVSALFDRNGNFIQGDQKTLEMRLTDNTLQNKLDKGVTLRANFDVKPGSYIVRCVVRDNQGDLSAQSSSIDLP